MEQESALSLSRLLAPQSVPLFHLPTLPFPTEQKQLTYHSFTFYFHLIKLRTKQVSILLLIKRAVCLIQACSRKQALCMR